jgi:hypothetical protein
MKRIFSVIILFAVAFVFPACLQTETSTVVHSDGKITRTLIFTGDSATIAQRKFPLPLDSSWTISVNRNDSANFVLRAVQTFDNDQAMNHLMQGEHGKTITVVARLEQRFRWFFTMYDYTEIWKCYRTVDAVPLVDYVSLQDMSLFYEKDLRDKSSASAEDSSHLKRIDDQSEEWRRRNIFESFFRVLRAGVAQVNSPRFSLQTLEEKRTDVYREVATALAQNPTDIPRVKKLFADAYHSDITDRAFTANQQGLDSLKTLLDFDGGGTGKIEKTSIAMPGIILRTNAEGLDGSIGTWKDAFALQYLRDVELRISSRVVNWWAVIISGIVVVGLAGYLVAAGLRKRRKGGLMQ